MKRDYKEEWWKDVEFEDEDYSFSFKELAVGLLFCALVTGIMIVAIYLRRACGGI